MKKEIMIAGMSCAHCQKKVEEVLGALPQTTAKVNLKKEKAVVTTELEDAVLRSAIENAGYEVKSIINK